MARASRSKRSLNCSAETLMATSRPSRGSCGAIHLAHATRADGREDFVGAEFVAGLERHMTREVQFSRSGRRHVLDSGASEVSCALVQFCAVLARSIRRAHALPFQQLVLMSAVYRGNVQATVNAQ